MYDENITKTISAQKAKYTDKSAVLELEKDVKILYFGKRLETSKLFYNAKKQEVFDSAKFKLISENFTAYGKHLYFDVKNNIIRSKEINFNYRGGRLSSVKTANSTINYTYSCNQNPLSITAFLRGESPEKIDYTYDGNCLLKIKEAAR